MIRHFAAIGVTAFLAVGLSSSPVSGQNITVYSPPVLAPSVTVLVETPYTVWSPPVVTTPAVPLQRSYSVPIQQSYSVPIQRSYSVPIQRSYSMPLQRSYSVPIQRSYSMPITPTTPVQRSYSVPVTSAPVAVPIVTPAPRPVVVSPKIYIPGQPVRNVLRAVTP